VVPPLGPMLAKVAADIPSGDDWRYEPKWDGFRAMAFRDGDDVRLMSRDDRPLARYFPEVVERCAALTDDRWVGDGEIIVVRPDGLDFDLLLQRIHPADSRVAKLAVEWPATLVLFDLLARGDRDLRALDTDARRQELEAFARDARIPVAPDELARLGPGPEILLTPRTQAIDIAHRWYADEEGIGQDGVIARLANTAYREGERVMVKVKHRRSIDCVVAGYRVAKAGDGVGSLLLGLYGDGVLHYVGHTSSFKARERRELLAMLAPFEGDGGFGSGRAPGGQSRWSGGRDTAWVSLRPELVCEVSFERMQSHRFRHSARFLRWRDDREPASCTFAQLDRSP
jgi:ATP-dependent DNA ligase